MASDVLDVVSGARDELGKLLPLDVKQEDIIVFGKCSGADVNLNGADYLIMKVSDIMGILTPSKKKKK